MEMGTGSVIIPPRFVCCSIQKKAGIGKEVNSFVFKFKMAQWYSWKENKIMEETDLARENKDQVRFVCIRLERDYK